MPGALAQLPSLYAMAGEWKDEMLHRPDVPRGMYGTLRRVPHEGAHYSISSTENGLRVDKE